MTPETVKQQIPALEAFIQKKIDGLAKSYQDAVAVAEGPFGFLPANAANLGVIVDQVRLERGAQGTLSNYKVCISNWALNDPVYASLHLPQPPFPRVPQVLVDELVEMATAVAAGSDTVIEKVKAAAVKIGMSQEQTDSLVAILGSVL